MERLSPPQERETTQGGNGSDTEGLLGTSSGTSLCPAFNVYVLIQSSHNLLIMHISWRRKPRHREAKPLV